MSGGEREGDTVTERFPWVHPESHAADRWREIRREGDAEALARYEEMLGGPPGFCTSGWRADEDVSERFALVRPESRVARAWRKLQANRDGWGMQRLEAWLEAATTAADVRAIPLCDCGCGRVTSPRELAEDPGELLSRHVRLADGRTVVEGPEGVYRIHPEREGSS